MTKDEKNYKGLQIILKIGFIGSSAVYVIYSIVHILKGGEPFIFAGYIPIYAFMFGQIPASLLLGIASLFFRFYKKIPLTILQKEFWLFMINIIAFIALLSAVFLTDGEPFPL
jgi:hypothetical protein